MPIYEYECRDCGERVEAIQSVDAAPPSPCPRCGGSELRRLLSAPAFQFKGSGWYVTDYTNRGKATEKDGKDGKGSAGGESGGSDSATKSDQGETAKAGTAAKPAAAD